MQSIYPLIAAAVLSCFSLPSVATPVKSSAPFFSPYKDATINMDWNTNVISTKVRGNTTPIPLLPLKEKGVPSTSDSQLLPGNKAVTLAFATGECGSETWAGIPGETLAKANIKRFEQNDIDYRISTGGAAGVFTCSSPEGMKTFLDRYYSDNFAGLDIDIESGNQSQIEQLMRSAAKAQDAYEAEGKALPVSLTIATRGGPELSVNPLNIYGDWTLDAANKADLDYTVNLMVMDYGSFACTLSDSGRCDMAASAINAAKSLSSYHKIPLTDVELTPMIGMNDVVAEVTTIADIGEIVQFAKDNRLAGVHYWSFDRDTPCPQPMNAASPVCSGVDQKPLAYDQAFIDALSSSVR